MESGIGKATSAYAVIVDVASKVFSLNGLAYALARGRFT